MCLLNGALILRERLLGRFFLFYTNPMLCVVLVRLEIPMQNAEAHIIDLHSSFKFSAGIGIKKWIRASLNKKWLWEISGVFQVGEN